MTRFLRLSPAVLLAVAACHANDVSQPEPEPEVRHRLLAISGNGQRDTVARALTDPFVVRLVDSAGAPIPDAVVAWRVVAGDGALEASTRTDAGGMSTASYTLGTLAGLQSVAAHATDLGGPATLFTVTAINGLPAVLARRSGDQLVGEIGTALGAPLQVRLGDEFGNPVSGVAVAWTVDGGGAVTPETSVTDESGVASATRTLGGALGLQRTRAAVPDAPALAIEFTTQAVAPVPLVSTIPVGQNTYGAHDSFVRDGIAFLAAFDHGLLIYDVGNGTAGGTPESPVFLSRISTVGTSEAAGTVFTDFPAVHNVWWMWHNGERRYALVGEEGLIDIPNSAQGDIHVVDVSDLRAPREVARYDLPGAGAHYFHLDEARQILYAAFYNGGVVALDVSGTLEGDLAGRELGRIAPGGPGRTFTYGVQLVGDDVYASDMISGIWQLRLGPGGFTVLGGGNNLPPDPQRQGSEVAAGTGFLYSGTRIGSGRRSPVLIWELGAGGAPQLVDSLSVQTRTDGILDIKTSPDRRLLMVCAAGPDESGLYFYSLADPRRPALVGRYLLPMDPPHNFHTANFAEINGRLFALAAQDPPDMRFMLLDLSQIVNGL